MEKMQLTVDTGAITVALVDTDGNELGTFDFVPTDFDIIERYENVLDFLKNKRFDGGDDEADIFAQEIKDKMNYLLNTNAEALFSRCSPLTPLASGKLYFEDVIEQLGKLIEKTTSERLKRSIDRVNKATQDYT